MYQASYKQRFGICSISLIVGGTIGGCKWGIFCLIKGVTNKGLELSWAYNGSGHLYDDLYAPSLHVNNSDFGAKEVKIKLSNPFIADEPRKPIGTNSDFRFSFTI